MNALDVMTAHEVWACAETSDAREVAKMMAEHDVGAIPVLDQDGRLEGIVTDRDLCLKVIAEGWSFDTPIRRLMSEPVFSVHIQTSLTEIESLMREHKIRRLPVVDDDNRLQGFISIGDLARHCHTIGDEHELAGVLGAVSLPETHRF